MQQDAQIQYNCINYVRTNVQVVELQLYKLRKYNYTNCVYTTV
jgi:hypothetical protein